MESMKTSGFKPSSTWKLSVFDGTPKVVYGNANYVQAVGILKRIFSIFSKFE